LQTIQANTGYYNPPVRSFWTSEWRALFIVGIFLKTDATYERHNLKRLGSAPEIADITARTSYETEIASSLLKDVLVNLAGAEF
jgi:hypothetical protein